MNIGRIAVVVMLVAAAVTGAVAYWLQTYAFYYTIDFPPGAEVRIMRADGTADAIVTTDMEGIDADSSPLRYRACFHTDARPDALLRTHAVMEDPTPLNGPGWFSCYDAAVVGEALEAGDAVAFLSAPDIHPGVDRVVALFPDGRGYAWHQLNDEMKD